MKGNASLAEVLELSRVLPNRLAKNFIQDSASTAYFDCKGSCTGLGGEDPAKSFEFGIGKDCVLGRMPDLVSGVACEYVPDGFDFLQR